MKLNVGLSLFRLAFALLGIAGVVLQGATMEIAQPGYFTHWPLVVDFFSFFTVLTNLFISTWFALAFCSRQLGQAQWWGDQPEIKGTLLVAGSITVLVHWTLLVDIPIPTIVGGVANFFLHLLVPVGLWIDWLIVGDSMTRSYREMLRAWLVFPFLYVIYTEIRGPFAHWYPYFFLDPQALGGAGKLIVVILSMLLLVVTLISLTYWLYRKRGSLKK